MKPVPRIEISEIKWKGDFGSIQTGTKLLLSERKVTVIIDNLDAHGTFLVNDVFAFNRKLFEDTMVTKWLYDQLGSVYQQLMGH